MSKFELVTASVGCTFAIVVAFKSVMAGELDLGWICASIWSFTTAAHHWNEIGV